MAATEFEAFERRRGVGGKATSTVHLICSAHLDPVWQWRWEEGASEAVATFRTAARLLREHRGLIFCHNEAILYQWARKLDPPLFRHIRRLVDQGRWVIAGGWFLQPDLNLPGTESLIRHIEVGRRYFKEVFGAEPRVAYNFDSFGHSGGLPQILRQAGYEMYIHMRPQAEELTLPSDLFRWRGVDGTVIPAHRISTGLYHSERDDIEAKVRFGVEEALRLGRDTAVFWGLGNHGGGATREDLERIDDLMARESRVRIEHSTPDRFFEAVRGEFRRAPIVEGGLQRCFTGCYTSLSRLKRAAVRSLGRLVQAETLATMAWRRKGAPYPRRELDEAWRDHLFNDFHDVITGTCVAAAERDALDIYGRAAETARRVRLEAAAALNRGSGESPSLPISVFTIDPASIVSPVEAEIMSDYRPFRHGSRRLRLFESDGAEVECQEEPADALLPFHDWRRRICFFTMSHGSGASRFRVETVPGNPAGPDTRRSNVTVDPGTGFILSLKAEGIECLAGPLLEPLVIDDDADSWGTGRSSYGGIAGRFTLESGPDVIRDGRVRKVIRSTLVFGTSRIVMDIVIWYKSVLEFRLRVHWNEAGKRLKLRVPTAFTAAPDVVCEIPGGVIRRPADGQEHVHGRWLAIEDARGGTGRGLAIAHTGLHGFDASNGEIRLSALRSPGYCHERGLDISGLPPAFRSDLGIHELRLLVSAERKGYARSRAAAMADHLAAPPLVFAHLPFTDEASAAGHEPPFIRLLPSSVRMLSCRPARTGDALVLRLHESSGRKARVLLELTDPPLETWLHFKPCEIKTLRIERDGAWREVGLLEEA